MLLANATFSAAMAPGLIAASAPMDEAMRSLASAHESPISEPNHGDSFTHVPPAEPSGVTLRGSTRHSERRVLIFVESCFGFGHFNIVDLLAKELVRQDVKVAVASSTLDHNGSSFTFGGAQLFYLPPLGVNADGVMCTPDQQPFKYKGEYAGRIYESTRDVLERFDPSLIVYELYPFMQTWRDASTQAVNDHYQAVGKETPERVVLCRDIIHSSKADAVLGRLQTYCTRLMVRGDSRFARLEDSQDDWANISLPIHYVGNFAAKPPTYVRTPSHEDVVIFGGGGYRGEKDTRFLESIVNANRYSDAFRNRRFRIIISEGTPDSVVDSMLAGVDDNCTIMRTVGSEAFKLMLLGASAVVTRAGYNTCFELVGMRKPFVVVPRDTKEQRLRAQMLQSKGYGRAVYEEDLSAQAIARSLDASLTPVNGSRLDINFDGAERMAQALAGMLAGERRAFATVD